MGKNKVQSGIGRGTTVIKEPRFTVVIRTAGVIASVVMTIIVGWYAYETHELVRIGAENNAIYERQIKQYQKPRLSLGLTDEAKFIAYLKQDDSLTDTQANYELEKAKKLNPRIFVHIENSSPNDAYFVCVIRYDTDTGLFFIGKSLFDQIPTRERRITYVIGPPKGEEDIRAYLKTIYGWDPLNAIKEKGMLSPDTKPHNLIVLYLDNENTLYAVTRYAFNDPEGHGTLSLPEHYELGTGG
ncbi:MAG: hypothetical protein PVH29_06035 [Candidatus Zixiibacteriota bacterium]|jgi:hypothetical protein